MKSEFNLLNDCYNLFTDEKEPYHFYQGLFRYFDILNSNNELKKLIADIKQLEEKDKKKLNDLEAKTIAELKISKEEMRAAIKKRDIHTPEIDNLLKTEIIAIFDFQNQQNRPRRGTEWMATSAPMFKSRHEQLFEIAKILKERGYEDLVAKYVDKKPKYENIYGNYLFSKTYPEAVEEWIKIEKYKDQKIWFNWDELYGIYTSHRAFARAYVSQNRVINELEFKNCKWHLKFVHLFFKQRLLKEFPAQKQGTVLECPIKLLENNDVFINEKLADPVPYGTLPYQFLEMIIKNFPKRIPYMEVAKKLDTIDNKSKTDEGAAKLCSEWKRQLKGYSPEVAKWLDFHNGIAIREP